MIWVLHNLHRNTNTNHLCKGAQVGDDFAAEGRSVGDLHVSTHLNVSQLPRHDGRSPHALLMRQRIPTRTGSRCLALQTPRQVSKCAFDGSDSVSNSSYTLTQLASRALHDLNRNVAKVRLSLAIYALPEPMSLF